MIGWDEILEGGLSANATVMSWRGEKGGIEAAKMHHDVVMSPGGFVYLDHAQAKDGKTEPLAIGGYLPLSVVYGYNPRPAALSAEEQKYIMGVQGNMWTEYVPTNNKLEYMLFPRVVALAEVGWTQQDNKNYTNFSHYRLPLVLNDLAKWGINYRVPEADVVIDTDPSGRKKMTITPFIHNAQVFYTLDGHKADNTGTVYNAPILAQFSNNNKPITLKYVVVTPDNRVSNEFSVDVK